MSSVRPVSQNPAAEPQHNLNLPHYGVLMGGAKEIKIEGVGEASVGHLSIPRRALMEFVRLQVGCKNESEASLNDSGPARHEQWATNPDRIRVKSPGECARDLHASFADRGFIVPKTLVGKSFDEASELFDSVMPKSSEIDTLVGVIKHLSSHSYGDNADLESLREELLAGCYTAQSYLIRYTTEMEAEVINAPKTGKGKGGFDTLDVQYFEEIGKLLPEQKAADANSKVGKEIAASLKGASSSEELLKAVLEQNQLLMKQFAENSRQAPAATITEPTPSKRVAGTKKD